MKKNIILSTLLLVLAVAVNAQRNTSFDERENFQIGVKAGLTYSNVYNAEGEEFDADAKLGFTGGVFARFPLGTFLGFQPEILFTQKGFSASGRLLGNTYNYKTTTNFLEIPLLVALKPSEFIAILVGPQYSYLLKQRTEFTNSAFSYIQEEEFNQDNIRKNILGIVGGFDVNVNNIVIGARVGWDVQSNKGDGTSSTPKYKNLSGQLTVGLRL